MNISKLAKDIHQTNVEKGFWEGERNMTQAKALIASELYEALEAHRKDRYANLQEFHDDIGRYSGDDYTDEVYQITFKNHVKDTIEDEIADAFIRCLDLLYYHDREMIEIPSFIYKNKWDENFATNIYELNKVLLNSGVNTLAKHIICFCDKKGIDLEQHIKLKLKYNKTRKYKHGKNY